MSFSASNFAFFLIFLFIFFFFFFEPVMGEKCQSGKNPNNSDIKAGTNTRGLTFPCADTSVALLHYLLVPATAESESE